MGRMIRRAACAVMGLVVVGFAMGLGADHGEVAHGHGEWPAGMEGIVNVEHRVHGFFVNSEDVFFFEGDTARCNAFLVQCAAMEGVEVKVVLHPGKLVVRSPWDRAARDVEADWKLHGSAYVVGEDGVARAGAYSVRVDVWLDGDIDLEKLEIPEGVRVESGGEIERFVERHGRSGQDEAVTPVQE